MQIPAQAYDFSPRDIDEITSTLHTLLDRREFLTLGRYGEQFEREFAAYHNAPRGVATSSGTGALEIILRALDVAGQEVIVPTNTFAATAFAVIRAGARPVFADIGPDLTLDPRDAARRITPRTGAVITVHIGGLISPATPELAALCRARGLPLVEDAAHAHGSRLDGRAAGAFGIAAAFSFFSTKVMTTGEGGMILTADARLDQAARLLRDQAKVGGGNLHETCGYNWRMPEVQAIMGLVQLRRLDEFIARRQALAAQYDRLLAGIPGLHLLPTPASVWHNYYKYIAFVQGSTPDELKGRLQHDYGVALGGYVYELPLHEQPAFRAYAGDRLPVAEDLCRRHICPPIYPGLTDAQVAWVAQALQAVLSDADATASGTPR